MNHQIEISRRPPRSQKLTAYVSCYVDNEIMISSDSMMPPGAWIGESPPVPVTFDAASPELEAWNRKLDEYELLDEGWDGYHAPSPSERAIRTARNLVEGLLREKCPPDRVVPSVVGGIGITHKRQGKRVYIEIYNDGRVYALFSDGTTDPIAKEIGADYQSFKRFTAEIQEYIDA